MYMKFDLVAIVSYFFLSVTNLKYLKQMVRDTASVTFFEFSSNDVRRACIETIRF